MRIEKSNILLIAPSGSGKTHLVKSLASYLNVPLVIGDATSLTEAGYVGDDVESLLSKLILATEGDIDVAQRGIVFIDEIDKIQRSGSGFKDMRLGVQHALLKMLEGSVATEPPAGGYKHPAQPGVPFDTTNVLFICGGAFVGLEGIIAKRLGRGGFGFGQMSENRQVAADGLLRQVKPEDLEQFGLIPPVQPDHTISPRTGEQKSEKARDSRPGVSYREVGRMDGRAVRPGKVGPLSAPVEARS